MRRSARRGKDGLFPRAFLQLEFEAILLHLEDRKSFFFIKSMMALMSLSSKASSGSEAGRLGKAVLQTGSSKRMASRAR